MYARHSYQENTRAVPIFPIFSPIFPHPGNPSGIGTEGILSTRSSGVGARELQLTLRLSW
jgi:hypothetical protein